MVEKSNSMGLLGNAPPQKRDKKTPPEVIVNDKARKPVSDPTLGVSVTSIPAAAKHRLVTIGDSLTHGFQSGAIFNTDLSYPAIIAWELGLEHFQYPSYLGFGGLPLNIEYLLRDLEGRLGPTLHWWELPCAYFEARHHLALVEDWWERGPGSVVPNITFIMENLGMYGWDLRDALSVTAEVCMQRIIAPKDSALLPLIANASERAALRVLPSSPATSNSRNQLSTIGAAQELGEDGEIETLVVMLGANNALGAVTQLKVCWSQDADYMDLDKKNKYTVWNPKHFAAELKLVEIEIRKVRAHHVIWATVPHVTIAPVARGVGKSKVDILSRYFPYYTRPWITDAEFDPTDDPHITDNQARAIDSAIDQYNDSIAQVVSSARNQGLDWYLFDMAGVLDRLASRRYIDDVNARPTWWTPYPLPPELNALDPKPDSRFFCSGPDGRTQGGIFALDGVHPTTVGYGIVAQELINIMQLAGVEFFMGDGITRRNGPVRVDFKRLIMRDSLILNPPTSIGSDLKLIGWLDEVFEFFKRLLN